LKVNHGTVVHTHILSKRAITAVQIDEACTAETSFHERHITPMTVNADRLRTEALVMQQFTVEMEAGAM